MNNFEKLNIPANHPAKDEQDTFYISISNFCKFYNETDKKSVSKLDIV